MSSLIVLKPDCTKENKIGELISRFEHAGYPISKMFSYSFGYGDVLRLYGNYCDKPFYPRLEQQMLSGPSIIMRVDGPVELIRGVALKIRKDYRRTNPNNLIHASDSPEAAARELEIFKL